MDTDVMPAAPVGAPEEEELRKQRLLGVPGTVLNKPTPVMPPVSQPQPNRGTQENPTTPIMPPAAAALPQRSMPLQVKPTMPAAPIGPAEQRLQEHEQQQRPELHGWKKVLDVIGSMHPIGRAIESQIPGNPHQFDAEGNRLALEAAREQKVQGGRQEIEKGAAQAQFDTPQKRQAYMEANPDKFEGVSDFQKNDYVLSGKFPQKEPPEEKPHDVVKQYSDALAAGDDKKAGELLPRVKQFIENTQKPAKEPAPNEKEKDISDYIEANKLEDTAANREKARYAIAQRSKTEVNTDDAKEIANAIARGEQPPTTTGLYRNAAKVRAELARSGFNLAKAESDWHATQKHLATLNGAQQERLRQAVTFTSDSLGIIEDLYNQWQKVGITSGWKSFNKGSLATAKQLPGQAGNIANRLEAQINDLTAELGTVYKGGNSSTDESLKLAAKNLEADWNEKTFKDAIKQIRQNLEIRQNSIKHSQPAGVSEESPYTPAEEKPKGKTRKFNPF